VLGEEHCCLQRIRDLVDRLSRAASIRSVLLIPACARGYSPYLRVTQTRAF
jgi:hypothetical protein